MRAQISQNNYIIGDLDHNFEIIKNEYSKSCENDSDLIIFSELSVTGYPPLDLLQKKYFLQEVEDVVDRIARLTTFENCAILVGAPILQDDLLYNVILFIKNGEIQKRFLKNDLPNYRLFDEKRHFTASQDIDYFELNGKKVSVLNCEEAWNEENIAKVKSHKSDLIAVLNASPFAPDKMQRRFEVCAEFCKKTKLSLVYVNQVGGVDSIIFDGNSFVMDEKGEVVTKLAGFTTDSKSVYFDKDMQILVNKEEFVVDPVADLYSGATLGLRDYVAKTGFKKVLLGMSGGIDSALVATICVDALGSQNVRLVALPSRFNSSQSFDDANECAKNLGVELEIISIEDVFRSSLDVLNPHFKGKKIDATEENLQSRIRGLLLMAMSNKFNELLITTGNKSEMATGYATIYGDMNGAFNPIKDLYKTQIFELAKWRNKNVPDLSIYNEKDLIPTSIIEKEPSAELAFDQKDSDSLPDYDTLDKILHKMIEEEKSVAIIIKETGFDEDLVKKIAKLFYQNEYKRQQAVIGPKLSKMSFDRDRRYLITNKYWN